MSTKDFIEFYIGQVAWETGDFAHRVESSHRFMVNDLVNILKITYKVSSVSFALDHTADQWQTKTVQVVRLTKV